MNSVEKVKAVCKERKIPISKLERDLGYGNGYIGQLKKGTFPNDRLVEIANYLGLSTAYLTGENENKPAPKGNELNLESIINNMSREDLIEFIMLASARLKNIE